MANIFRSPLYSNLRPSSLAEIEEPQNLLESTLAAPVVAPFRTTEWENPMLRTQRGEATFAINLLLTVLAVAVAAPFSQTDWPNPAGIKQHEAGQHQNLLETTLGSEQPHPFSQIDWAIPSSRRGSDVGFVLNLLQGTLTPPTFGVPFVQTEWPLRYEPHRLNLGFALNLLQGTLTPPLVGAPFSQKDHPNPIQPIHPTEYGRVAGAFAGNIPPIPAPFVAPDLPLGFQKLTGGVLDSYRNAAILQPQPEPVGASEQTMPAIGRGNDPGDIQYQALLQTTLEPHPFSQIDWAIPSSRNVGDLGFALNLLQGTLEPPLTGPKPFGFEWTTPNPTVRENRQWLDLSWVQAILVNYPITAMTLSGKVSIRPQLDGDVKMN